MPELLYNTSVFFILCQLICFIINKTEGQKGNYKMSQVNLCENEIKILCTFPLEYFILLIFHGAKGKNKKSFLNYLLSSQTSAWSRKYIIYSFLELRNEVLIFCFRSSNSYSWENSKVRFHLKYY